MTILAAVLIPSPVWGQADESRREITTPGLVLETGSRTAACDVLTFTNQGRFLFATGDDKIVRTWKYTPQGLAAIVDPAPAGSPQPILRWPSHRERYGNIYAAAVSPDPMGQYIVVGGLGLRPSQLAVVDRYSGEISNAVSYLSLEPKLGSVSIWSVAFSPTGEQVACGTGGGAVWVWDWKTSKKPVQIGQHENPPGLDYNYVRFLVYQKDHLISADEHGSVYRWSLGQSGKTSGARIFAFSNQEKSKVLIRFFALSGDAQWLAAALESNVVEIRPLQGGGSKKTIAMPNGTFPSALAFHPQGRKLAVSLRTVDPRSPFFKETSHKVAVYDVSAAPREEQSITPSYRVEALAFHPDGRHLATAGGNNHDVNVYDLDNPTRPLGQALAGPGDCIWGVSLSTDGRYVGFQTQRNPDPDHPNRRALGRARVFDLNRRLFTTNNTIAWTTPVEKSADGWEVEFSEKTERRADRWFVRKAGRESWPLPWETKIDEFPRCYAFLQPTDTHPTRLIVGHMYGASIYELTSRGPQRTRILTGHDSEVTAMVVSADGKRLITGSRDQTIAGWSLEDWHSHPQLGANLFLKDGKLWVGAVDQGSPGWELGLSTDDEVVLLVRERKIIYNRSGKFGPDTGSAALALETLQKPTAGEELYFGWKRPGDIRLREQLTTLRERPIWRFFPTKDGEWVLWRYLDFLYDTSTRGDAFIGWQRNLLDDKGGFNVKGTPMFYRAEQFRKSYHNPEKLSQTVMEWSRTVQGKSTFVDIEPPRIQVLIDGLRNPKVQVNDKGFRLSVKVSPVSERQNQELTRVILWINDFQLIKWEDASLRQHIVKEKNDAGLARGIFTIDDIAVPPTLFRSGDNVLFVQSYNKAGVRGESSRILITNPRPRRQANLYGLFIGVGDYAKSKPRQINLGAPQDAEVLADVWGNNRGKQYVKASIRVLKDKQITPTLVLAEFDKLAATVKPDDLLVFHLGGHGVGTRKLVAEVKAADLPKAQRAQFDQQLAGLSQFLFLCGDFDFLRIRDTTISLDDLYEKLVKLPCHKLITLDACNAAAVDPTDPAERKGTDIIRLFTMDGVGPIIFAACKAEESAIEFPGFVVEPASGLFAQAIVKAIQDDFGKGKKRALEPEDMFTDLRSNIGMWVKELRANAANKDLNQNPQFFLPVLERSLAILVGRE
jgi:WD40 repeat protein